MERLYRRSIRCQTLFWSLKPGMSGKLKEDLKHLSTPSYCEFKQLWNPGYIDARQTVAPGHPFINYNDI